MIAKVTSSQIHDAILRTLEELTPDHAMAVLIGRMIGPIVGKIPEDQWQAMIADYDKPCGEPDCDCEKLRIQLIPALHILRNDYLEQTAF